MFYNDTILDGANLWTSLNIGSESFIVLSAGDVNTLYGLKQNGTGKHLMQMVTTETDCSDTKDNDADGLVDANDPDCFKPLATQFCATHSGKFCTNRYLASTPTYGEGLVVCKNNLVDSFTRGACQHGSMNNNDSIMTDRYTPTPTGMVPYCNVVWPDGTWSLSFTGTTPCTTLLSSKPNGKIVRAGLYHNTNMNSAFVNCDDGAVGPSVGTGSSPLTALFNAVGKGTNRCFFTVSANAMPVFDKAFDPATASAGVAKHAYAPIPLKPLGNGQVGCAQGIDRFAKNVEAFETAYDVSLGEGTPLYALADGTVLPNGSRDRDISGMGLSNSTPHQGEVYVNYNIGSDPTYREIFVGYDAHMRRRLVESGQTVRRGQLLGYVGRTGAAGGPHLHMGMFRLSNTNLHTASALDVGYHLKAIGDTNGPPTFLADAALQSGNSLHSTNAIDMLGWGASVPDPLAYQWRNTALPGIAFAYVPGVSEQLLGISAFSVDLFKTGQRPTYNGNAARPVCGTLSNLGTKDFRIDFTVTTSTTAQSALIAQRAICNRGQFWDVRLVNNVAFVEIDDGTNYSNCTGTKPLNDGVPHIVDVNRAGGQLTISVDCVQDVSCTLTSATSFASLAAVTTGSGDPCIGFDGTQALSGTITDVCVGTFPP